MAKSYYESSYGCPVHGGGYDESERTCSCRGYWANEDDMSPKALREDSLVIDGKE